ncbi:MAG: DUF6552 family protein [Pseudomonadota bacterium]|nr:DUF6552 family protein [Pseudomonadota bacterium]
MQFLKILSSFLLLTGVLCTNINLYPYNIFFQSLGAVGWVCIGFMTQNSTLLYNFIPQLPLFLVGYYLILSS